MKTGTSCFLVVVLGCSIGYAGNAYTFGDYTFSDYTWITNPSNGHLYARTLQYANWNQSEIWARDVGGDLVTINDLAENTWLSTQFAGLYRIGHEGDPVNSLVWIGLNYDITGNWAWVSGQPLTITPPWLDWAGGGPLPFNSYYGGMPYAYLEPDTHPRPGTWWNADYSLTWPSYGIIELERSSPAVPVPGAIVLAGIGIGLVSRLRRRRVL